MREENALDPNPFQSLLEKEIVPDEGEGMVPGEITKMLENINAGDKDALNDLIPLVYQNLRNTAAYYLKNQSSGHTLQPTALIHEVYLKLSESSRLSFSNRKQFFWFAGFLMRRILIDYARYKKSQKHGGDRVLVSFNESMDVLGRPDIDVATLLALDELLDRLMKMDERQAQVVQLRFFAGMNLDEISEILGISRATIKREWRTAKLWLARELKRKREDGSDIA